MNFFTSMLLIIFQVFMHSFIVKSSSDELKSIKLPPCATCRFLTETFIRGMERTNRGKFAGGDSAWEEEKMGQYKTSEVRLIEIQEKLCMEIERGQNQCLANAEEHEELLENWWFNLQKTKPDMHAWMCIETLKVCCPVNHYGHDCLPCSGGAELPCGGNGKCKGNGTRKGNGGCDCNKGYKGDLCSSCSDGYYESYRDGSKLICDVCHKSCEGTCSGAGPKSCQACKDGWIMKKKENVCLDVDECSVKNTCKVEEFCLNNEGSFKCHKCDNSCEGCMGDGPDMCYKCAKGFTLKNDICADDSEQAKEDHLAFARYVTYAGLTVATCIIFQKHTTMAAVIGLIVASYISFSEYYLTHMQSSSNSANEFKVDPLGGF